MPNTTYGTPYAQSSDLVSNWPGVSSNVADRIDDVSFKGNGLNDQTGTSYTLVLTDAGKTVTLNNASAVTVTVPTNASVTYETGTEIQLTNKGAGTVTIAAAGGVTINNNQTLTQNKTATLKKLDTNTWVLTTAPGSGMSLITSGTLSGGSVVLSSIPTNHKDLKLIVRNYLPASDGQAMAVRVNNDSNANRYAYPGTNGGNGNAFGATFWNPFGGADNATSQGLLQLEIFDYANTTTWKAARAWGIETNATTTTQFNYVSAYFCAYNQTAAITSLTLLPTTGNFTSGDYLLYGIG